MRESVKTENGGGGGMFGKRGEMNLRSEVGGWIGPDEGALARGVLDEFNGHFFGGTGAEPPT